MMMPFWEIIKGWNQEVLFFNLVIWTLSSFSFHANARIIILTLSSTDDDTNESIYWKLLY